MFRYSGHSANIYYYVDDDSDAYLEVLVGVAMIRGDGNYRMGKRCDDRWYAELRLADSSLRAPFPARPVGDHRACRPTNRQATRIARTLLGDLAARPLLAGQRQRIGDVVILDRTKGGDWVDADTRWVLIHDNGALLECERLEDARYWASSTDTWAVAA